MKEKSLILIKLHSVLILSLFYIVTAFTECFIFYSVIWAGFRGFGDPPLAFTKEGEVYSSILILVLPLLILCILGVRIVKNYQHKKSTKYYVVEILLCISGIMVGFLIFMFVSAMDLVYILPFGWLDDIINGWLEEYPAM